MAVSTRRLGLEAPDDRARSLAQAMSNVAATAAPTRRLTNSSTTSGPGPFVTTARRRTRWMREPRVGAAALREGGRSRGIEVARSCFASQLVIASASRVVEQHGGGKVDQLDAAIADARVGRPIGVKLPHEPAVRSSDLRCGRRIRHAEKLVKIVLRLEVADLHDR